MEKQIIDFLQKNRVCALAVGLPDGSIHSSAMHYSQQVEPLEIYFSTDSECRKYLPFKSSDKIQASIVIGSSEEEWITLQVSGVLEVVKDPAEIRKVKDVHYAKIPGSKKFEGEPTTVYLKFLPNWFRYTDFNTDPVTYLTNQVVEKK